VSLAAGPQPGYRPARSPFSWLLERELLRFLRIWRYTIAGQALAPLMMLVVFGFALNHQVTEAGGIPYNRFILPGLVAQTIVICGYANGTTSLFDARRDRYLNDVLASPLRWWEINLACVTAAFIRSIITGGIVAGIGIAIVHGSVQRPLVLLAGVPAVMIVWGQIGVLAGVHIRSMDQNIALQQLIVQPLTFLGGTFYSVSALPGVWNVVSHLNPVFYGVQLVRIAFLGRADTSTAVTLAILWGLAAVLSVWSLVVFRTGRTLKD
jgi:ABC-2 type transport system permease protein